MLPLEKISAPRNVPTPLELCSLGLAAEDPQADSETVSGRTAADVEFSRLHFRNFTYPEAAGPFQALDQLWVLCCHWLQPETYSKEQLLEQLVLEQFLSVLPSHIRPWVVAQHPESCRKAASLVDDFLKSLEEPARPTPGIAMLPEQGYIEDQMSEARPTAAEPKLQKLKFAEAPLCEEEWGHLDPAVENLKIYRKLLLWGYQLAQPDVACRQETEELEELRLVDREPGDSSCSGGRWCQQDKDGSLRETIMESLTHEILSYSSMGTTLKKDEPLQKDLDPQEQEARSVTIVQRQSVIQQPGQGQGSTLQSLPLPMVSDTQLPGLGRKRPYPKDGAGPTPKCGYGVSDYQQRREKQEAATETGPSSEKPYICIECGVAFAWISHFTDHLMNHSGRKIYACRECWKTFHFSLALAEHQKTHEKEKGYVLGRALGSYPATCRALASRRAGGGDTAFTQTIPTGSWEAVAEPPANVVLGHRGECTIKPTVPSKLPNALLLVSRAHRTADRSSIRRLAPAAITTTTGPSFLGVLLPPSCRDSVSAADVWVQLQVQGTFGDVALGSPSQSLLLSFDSRQPAWRVLGNARPGTTTPGNPRVARQGDVRGLAAIVRGRAEAVAASRCLRHRHRVCLCRGLGGRKRRRALGQSRIACRFFRVRARTDAPWPRGPEPPRERFGRTPGSSQPAQRAFV
ncbi:zinc finger and SCAN domain-containing protein 18 [Sorex fumeus]|uniref:zinc finger and SCAN domain-containing protein 18 n=1 Tax=Sorex fumeus TaxID=62283 RepID=UPI0024AD458F|nr:zinc finger and SCAN domain-containing protein 18 [Sorex fumeus]